MTCRSIEVSYLFHNAFVPLLKRTHLNVAGVTLVRIDSTVGTVRATTGFLPEANDKTKSI
jgi:hypothetical protein